MERDEVLCPRSRGRSVPREEAEFKSSHFPCAKVWLNDPLRIFRTQAWRRRSEKPVFTVPHVNAAPASHPAPAYAVRLEVQPLLRRCFPTSGLQRGHAQVEGESKEPGRGKTGTSNATGETRPLLWASLRRPATLSPQLKTPPGFSLGAAPQTRSQQPSHRQGRPKARLPCFDLQAEPQNEHPLSSAVVLSGYCTTCDLWASFHLASHSQYAHGDQLERNTCDFALRIRDFCHVVMTI